MSRFRWPGRRRDAVRRETLVDAYDVLDRIAFMMERVDNDISVPVACSDVVESAQLTRLVRDLDMGPQLCAHVVNTALRIMLARYPGRLVRLPLPATFDLRRITPLTLTDHQHETTRVIFDRRCSGGDLAAADLHRELGPCSVADQVNVVMALFVVFGLRVAAIQRELAAG